MIARRLQRLLLVILLGAGLACEDATRPVTSAMEVRVRQIYDAGAWLRRVPMELAVSFYARAKLEGFLDELELPSELADRLRARLASDDFVDELVPFLLFVYELYQAPEGESAETFDDHLRATFGPGDVPGIEHSMFTFAPQEDAEGGAGLPGIGDDIARDLLAFYDVLYLKDRTEAQGMEERLACASRDALPDLERAVDAASPSVSRLLASLGERMEEQAELGAALRAVREDPVKLEAATAALVRFIDQTVCRNYRFFATRAFRTEQLGRWMREELTAAEGGALWTFLEEAQRRRHGVVIVVDGLQGKLMEALARGDGEDPFVRAIVAEHDAAGGPAPRARSLRSPPEQNVAFLRAFRENGYAHPQYLPFFRALLADARGHWVPVGLSTTPTISVRNIPIALTGAPVAGDDSTGLPNFHFVERGYAKDGEQRGRAYYFFGSDAVDLVALTEQAGMRTLFARMPELGSFSCTAQYDEHAHQGVDALLNLGLGETLRDFGERLCAAELEQRAETELTLRTLRTRLLALRESLGTDPPWWRFWSRFGRGQERTLAESLIDEIAEKEQRTLPELFLAYNPWPDHFAHFEGPFADEILSPSGELNRLDYWLGRFVRAYERAGALERTVFGLSGDHGLSPVWHLLNPEVEVFDALRDEGIDFRVVKISSDEGEGPKLTNPFDPPSMKGLDAVVASTAGGNYMIDLFVDQGAQFARQPLAEELRALRPLAQPDARPVDLLEEIATRLADSLDYLAVRETPCTTEGGAVRLVGHRDGMRGEAVIRRQGDRIHVAIEGADLLDTNRLTPYEDLDDAERSEHAALRARCLGAPRDDVARWCTRSEWRRMTSFTVRPDAVAQLAHLYDSDRAGTVNLFPRDGVGYNSVVPGRHAGESFHEKNAFVALWGRPLATNDGDTLRSAPNAALPLAIHEHLAGERPVRGRDGWGYDPLPERWFERAP